MTVKMTIPEGFSSIEVDNKGRVFIGCRFGLFCLTVENGAIKLLEKRFPTDGSSRYVSSMTKDENFVYFFTQNRLNRIRLNTMASSVFTGEIEFTSVVVEKNNGYISKIVRQNNSTFWLTSFNILIQVSNPFTSNSNILDYTEPSVQNSIPTSRYSDILVTKHESVFIATFGAGVYYRNQSFNYFTHLKFSLLDKDWPSPYNDFGARSMAHLKDNLFLLSTIKGLYQVDYALQEVTKIFSYSGPYAEMGTVFSIHKLSDELFLLGTFKGAYTYNYATNQITFIDSSIPDQDVSNYNKVMFIVPDKRGNLWFWIEQKELICLDKQFNLIVSLDSLNSTSVKSLIINDLNYYEDEDELIASTTNGIFRVFLNNESKPNLIAHYGVKNDEESSLKTNQILSACKTDKHTIWVGTFGAGLSRLTVKEGSLQKENNDYIAEIIVDENDDVAFKATRNIFTDRDGNIWFTGQKIGRYNPEKSQLSIFDEKSGTNGMGYLTGGVFKNDSILFFLNSNNLNYVHCNSLESLSNKNKVIFSNLFVSGKRVNANQLVDKKVLLENDISLTNTIRFNHNQNSFTLTFSMPDFSELQHTVFLYKVEGLSGYEKTWTKADRNQISFTGLGYGNYRIKVKTIDKHGLISGNTATLDVHISAPFWLSIWFILLVISMLVCITWLIFRIRMNALRKQKELLENMVLERTAELEQKNNELEKAVQSRSRFLSIIGHDLKNPFATVLGFSNYLRNEYSELDDIERQKILNYIFEDSNKLFNLLENLLEWGKQQTAGKIILNFVPVNLWQICSEVIDVSSINNKNVSLINNVKRSHISLADANAVNLIFRNLLWNAIKYSQTGGKVEINSECVGNEVIVNVEDYGVGMTDEVLNKLFSFDDLFSVVGTKGEKGSGIGLINSKLLIESMGGRIWVSSTLGKGSTFSFSLPLYAHD
jgi:signal transduction histidine kinase